MLRPAARGLTDLRFARLPQPQARQHAQQPALAHLPWLQIAPAPRHRRRAPQTPVCAILPCAPLASGGQPHLRPLLNGSSSDPSSEPPPAPTLPAIRSKLRTCSRAVQQRRMQPVTLRRRRQRIGQHRTAVHDIADTPRLNDQPWNDRPIARTRQTRQPRIMTRQEVDPLPAARRRPATPRSRVSSPPLSSVAALILPGRRSQPSTPCACSLHEAPSGASSARL